MNKEFITLSDIDFIINNIYNNKIPNDEICNIINYFIKKEKIMKIYKVFGIIIKDNIKKIKNDNDSNVFIYEYIHFIDNYSPLLRYYDLHNIKYELYNEETMCVDKNMLDTEFNKRQYIKNFKYCIDNFDFNKKFLIENELKLYNFIENLIKYDYHTWKIFLNINNKFTMSELSFLDDYITIKDITEKEWNIKYKKKTCKIFLY